MGDEFSSFQNDSICPPPLSIAIQRWGYIEWWLKCFGHQKGGGACNIILEKKIISPYVLLGDRKIAVTI
jgi:hypothetical protein